MALAGGGEGFCSRRVWYAAARVEHTPCDLANGARHEHTTPGEQHSPAAAPRASDAPHRAHRHAEAAQRRLALDRLQRLLYERHFVLHSRSQRLRRPLRQRAAEYSECPLRFRHLDPCCDMRRVTAAHHHPSALPAAKLIWQCPLLTVSQPRCAGRARPAQRRACSSRIRSSETAWTCGSTARSPKQ